MWVLYNPKQCRNKPRSGGSDKSDTELDKTRNKTGREKAMPAIFEDNDKDNSDSDESAASRINASLCARWREIFVAMFGWIWILTR